MGVLWGFCGDRGFIPVGWFYKSYLRDFIVVCSVWGTLAPYSGLLLETLSGRGFLVVGADMRRPFPRL